MVRIIMQANLQQSNNSYSQLSDSMESSATLAMTPQTASDSPSMSADNWPKQLHDIAYGHPSLPSHVVPKINGATPKINNLSLADNEIIINGVKYVKAVNTPINNAGIEQHGASGPETFGEQSIPQQWGEEVAFDENHGPPQPSSLSIYDCEDEQSDGSSTESSIASQVEEPDQSSAGDDNAEGDDKVQFDQYTSDIYGSKLVKIIIEDEEYQSDSLFHVHLSVARRLLHHAIHEDMRNAAETGWEVRFRQPSSSFRRFDILIHCLHLDPWDFNRPVSALLKSAPHLTASLLVMASYFRLEDIKEQALQHVLAEDDLGASLSNLTELYGSQPLDGRVRDLVKKNLCRPFANAVRYLENDENDDTKLIAQYSMDQIGVILAKGGALAVDIGEAMVRACLSSYGGSPHCKGFSSEADDDGRAQLNKGDTNEMICETTQLAEEGLCSGCGFLNEACDCNVHQDSWGWANCNRNNTGTCEICGWENCDCASHLDNTVVVNEHNEVVHASGDAPNQVSSGQRANVNWADPIDSVSKVRTNHASISMDTACLPVRSKTATADAWGMFASNDCNTSCNVTAKAQVKHQANTITVTKLEPNYEVPPYLSYNDDTVAVAISDSNSDTETLIFRIGDSIFGVKPLDHYSFHGPLMSGFCNGNWGTFLASSVSQSKAIFNHPSVQSALDQAVSKEMHIAQAKAIATQYIWTGNGWEISKDI